RQSGARQDATAVRAKEHPPQHRRKVDRRGVESEEPVRFTGPLDPVNVLGRALLEKNGNAVPCVADAPPEFLQLRLQNFVIGAFHRLGYTRLKHSQSTCDRIRNKIDIADTKLAAFTKIRSRFDRGEKFIDVINQFRREPDTDRIADYGEQSFARPRIIEPL